MSRFHHSALTGLGLLLACSTSAYAQNPMTGAQCVPMVANPSMYGDCSLRVVQG
jgi:hypothetical protein